MLSSPTPPGPGQTKEAGSAARGDAMAGRGGRVLQTTSGKGALAPAATLPRLFLAGILTSFTTLLSLLSSHLRLFPLILFLLLLFFFLLLQLPFRNSVFLRYALVPPS